MSLNGCTDNIIAEEDPAGMRWGRSVAETRIEIQRNQVEGAHPNAMILQNTIARKEPIMLVEIWGERAGKMNFKSCLVLSASKSCGLCAVTSALSDSVSRECRDDVSQINAQAFFDVATTNCNELAEAEFCFAGFLSPQRATEESAVGRGGIQ